MGWGEAIVVSFMKGLVEYEDYKVVVIVKRPQAWSDLSYWQVTYNLIKMADLEAVLADVSYLMAMEKSKCTPAARASKKIILPDPR